MTFLNLSKKVSTVYRERREGQEPLEQPSGQCGNSTIGWLLQEKTGQALGSTSFNVRPRMPSLNCDINDLFGPTEANSSFCHNNDLIGTIPIPPRPISFSFENLNMVLWLEGPESCIIKVKVKSQSQEIHGTGTKRQKCNICDQY